MIAEVVARYLEIYPRDRSKLKRLLQQLESGEALDDRRNFHGHIAGDSVIFSADLRKVLLIYHTRFKKWQQPGGHWDPGEEGPWLTAMREAEEETGLRALKRVNLAQDYRVPIHIVTGRVTPSPVKGEPIHWHHDFRYGFIAVSEKLPQVRDSGVSGAKWIKLAQYNGEGAHRLNISIARLKRLVGLKG